MRTKRLPLSVAMVTYNEEDIVGRTLEAVKDIASEIVVVDSHSTDRTREIAESYGARVYVEEWKGYVGQKNSALRKCTCEWILFLDADEVVSEELRRSIVEELRDPKYDGYLINRRTYYLGRFLRYTWQPEWRLLLVRREADPLWTGEPHAFVSIKSERISRLKGDLYHFSYKGFYDHVRKALRASRETAISKYRAGERCSMLNLILNPLWAFVKTYIIRKGILDGYPGLIASGMTMIYTFFKYAFLYEIQLRERYGDGLWRR